MQFYVYRKSGHHVGMSREEAPSFDAMADMLGACKPCWKAGKVFGHRRVKLSGMPHARAILIDGDASGFVAFDSVESAPLIQNQVTQAYDLDR